ncbi:MAG TPA: hypothetical protein ENO36_01315 [Fervidicoccus fontis]|uniref:Uncharacterized protein n=1 Tax=Fervidicoccus fontis TaxID=683846 RepID=A0A7C2UJ14_9CREN|nr:MAG: hypothetical protein C0179_07510 [Fervidicoccus sp.]HEU97482.1 hypothetical protein [Fervidicoccus fontis]
MRSRIEWVFLFALIMTLLPSISVSAQENPQDPFPAVLNKLVYLNSMNVNVTSLVDNLNKALILYQNGNISQAIEIINQIDSNATLLMNQAESIHYKHLVEKYSEVAILLSIPIVIYFLLPRAYAYYWFVSRKRWKVREK